MLDVAFIAEIEPCPKGRARIGRTKTGVPVAFTPAKTRRWESDFAAIATRWKPSAIIAEPVYLELVFVVRRPQRLMRKKDPDQREPAMGRPDLDNLEKAVMDAMKSWWSDDSIVTRKLSSKWYASKNESPHVEVRLASAWVVP